MRVKLIFAAPALAALLLALGAWSAGLTPGYLLYGAPVGSGMAAKLLCSSRHVSGFSREQARSDLEQYSPLLERVAVRWNDSAKTVTASLFGLSERTARFVDGRGCAVDYGVGPPREPLALGEPAPAREPWPLGDNVGRPDAELRRMLEDLLRRDNEAGRNTRALLVARGGRILAEAYAQETGPATPLLGWSMSKSLMSVMLGNLEMRGLLRLDQPTGFPEWRDDSRSGIALTDLLTMTDGLEFVEDYSPGDDVTLMLFTAPSTGEYALRSPLASEPGSRFNYSSGSAVLLSLAHQRAFDSPRRALEDFVEHIWRPMGFRNAVFETDAAGLLAGSSYFYASARDWARLAQLMLNGGEINGRRIVGEDWVRRAMSANGSENGRAYGYQWWLNSGGRRLRYADLPEDAIFARGNREQVMMAAPSLDLIILRLGWTAGDYPTNANFSAIIDFMSRDS